MAVNKEQYFLISEALRKKNVTLVAVSKTKPVEDIRVLYDLGHRDFGENYVQELVEKQRQLPADIRWHFIGHLQSNKVKYIAPFVHLIHGVDRFKLLTEIDAQGSKVQRVIGCLLQVHIAQEETKFGFPAEELPAAFNSMMEYRRQNKMSHVEIKGLMGMASMTHDMERIAKEFRGLKESFDQLSTSKQPLSVLSMGMSSEYATAVEQGSTMVRIGSLLFGERPAG